MALLSWLWAHRGEVFTVMGFAGWFGYLAAAWGLAEAWRLRRERARLAEASQRVTATERRLAVLLALQLRRAERRAARLDG